MSKMSNSLNASLKLAAILAVAATMTGCISAKSKPTDLAAPATSAVAPALNQWTVTSGEHLWGISGIWEVFNVSEKWPLLYKANLDQIKDADLIYPGQILDIPRDSSVSEVDAAIRHAKTRGAWAVGPVEASDTEYLKNSS